MRRLLVMIALLLGCSTQTPAPDEASPPGPPVPAGFVLVPRTVADVFAREINELRDAKDTLEVENVKLQIEAAKWRARNDCT